MHIINTHRQLVSCDLCLSIRNTQRLLRILNNASSVIEYAKQSIIGFIS